MNHAEEPRRKRQASWASSLGDSEPRSSRLPNDTINPLSHTPSTLSQFLVAGLAETQQVPSNIQPGFPHRPWRDLSATRQPRRRRRKLLPGTADSGGETSGPDSGHETTGGETDEGTESEGSTLPRAKTYAAERAALRPLARSIVIFLSRDEISAAKRAFGLLMRTRVSGKLLDIRRNHYWELGAEILMRERPPGDDAELGPQRAETMLPIEGREDEGSEQQWHSEGVHPESAQNHRRRRRPLYPFANIPKVKAYFEDLIRQYPHHLGARKAASALQFWPALLSYEIYQVHAQHSYSLEELDVEAAGWEMEEDEGRGFAEVEAFEPHEDGDGDLDTNLDNSTSRPNRFDSIAVGEEPARNSNARDTRLRQARDEIRQQTLDVMREIASNMDRLLENLPFSRSAELLRLAGIVSLYIGDLLIPAHAPSQSDRDDAQMRRFAERESARIFFQRMAEQGGHIEPAIRQALGMEGEASEEPSLLPVFSSLPIRDHGPAR